MNILGNYFSEEERRRVFEESLVVGQVFYLRQDFLSREKEKYFLLVACSDPLTFFTINSKIHPLLSSKKHLLDCQVLIEHLEHNSIVEHDCYINCTEICKKFTMQEIEKQIVDNPNRIKGKLNDKTIEKVYIALMKAGNIETKYRTPILEAIKSILP